MGRRTIIDMPCLDSKLRPATSLPQTARYVPWVELRKTVPSQAVILSQILRHHVTFTSPHRTSSIFSERLCRFPKNNFFFYMIMSSSVNFVKPWAKKTQHEVKGKILLFISEQKTCLNVEPPRKKEPSAETASQASASDADGIASPTRKTVAVL